MEHTDIYSKFCKDRFDRIEADRIAAAKEVKDDLAAHNAELKAELGEIKTSQAEILGVLRGKNGDAGLCEKVRRLENVHKAVWGAVIFVVTTVFFQGLIWIREQLK